MQSGLFRSQALFVPVQKHSLLSPQHPTGLSPVGLFAINCKLNITRVLTRVTFNSHTGYCGCSLTGRAADCGSAGCGFKSRQSPIFYKERRPNNVKKLLKCVSALLFVGTMVAIFLFSNETAEMSAKTSSSFQRMVTERGYLTEMTKLFPVRKIAHFSIYFILGTASFFTFKLFEVKYAGITSLFACFLYACSDELHQLFVDGRGCSFFDVLIDTMGSSVAISLLLFLSGIFHCICKKVKKVFSYKKVIDRRKE